MTTGAGLMYVTLAPTGAPSQGVVEAVAKMLNKDVFAVRVILNGKIPKVAGYYQDAQTAESVAQGLRSLGYPVIVCLDSELRQRPSGRFRAYTLQLGERDVSFRDKGGQTRVFEEGSLFLILRLTARTYTEKEVGASGADVGVNATAQNAASVPNKTVITGKINVPATLMTGIPIMKKTKEKPKVQSVQYGEFLRLYDRTSLEPVVEILQSSFDYSSLGDKKALSSTENMNVIIRELKDTFPQAIVDTRLIERSRVDLPFVTPDDEIEINSRLICLHHRGCGGPSGCA